MGVSLKANVVSLNRLNLTTLIPGPNSQRQTRDTRVITITYKYKEFDRRL